MKYRDRRSIHVLSTTDLLEMTPEQRRWLRAIARKQGLLLPIMGGDGEGEGGAGAGEGEGEGQGSGGSSGGGEGDDDEESSGSGDSEDDEDEEDEEEDEETKNRKADVSMPRSEYERLKRIAREHDTEKKRREKEQRREQEKRRKEQGQYEELLQEKDEQIRNVEAERDESRYQLDAFKRRVRVSEAAKRLNFKDPEDAFRFLSDEDTEDDVSTERALKRLAKGKPYLVHERRSTGAPIGGDGVTLTVEQLKNMSQEEINKRWPEVQKTLATG